MPAYTAQNTGFYVDERYSVPAVDPHLNPDFASEGQSYSDDSYHNNVRSPVDMIHTLSLASPSWNGSSLGSEGSDDYPPRNNMFPTRAHDPLSSRQSPSHQHRRNQANQHQRHLPPAPPPPARAPPQLPPSSNSDSRPPLPQERPMSPSQSTRGSNAPWSKLKQKFKKKPSSLEKNLLADARSTETKSSDEPLLAPKKSDFYYPSARSRANPRSNKNAALSIKRTKRSGGEGLSQTASTGAIPENSVPSHPATTPTPRKPPAPPPQPPLPKETPNGVNHDAAATANAGTSSGTASAPSSSQYSDAMQSPPMSPFHSEPYGDRHDYYAPSSISGYTTPDRVESRRGFGGFSSAFPPPPSSVSTSFSASVSSPPPLHPPSSSARPTKKGHSKLDTYPLNPYDTTLLKGDEATHHLLRRLTVGGSPSFHAYGNMPPASVLDIGCGEGHWLVDAARAWAGFGTLVTGLDAVDISRSIWPKAESLGVNKAIKVVKSNFIRDPLPFPDNSFDLVRLANLSLAIPLSRWDWVLREAFRVCSVGGRLELIDDSIIFPPADIEGDAGATARDLETLWGEMLKREYLLHLNPSEFLHGFLEDVFGHARRVGVFQLSSAREPPSGTSSMIKSQRLISGLKVWPTNVFLTMSDSELELHSSKYSRMLLGCKKSLVDYVSSLNRPTPPELSDGHHDPDFFDEYQDEDTDIVLSAIWEYENGLSDRCKPTEPVGEHSDPPVHRDRPNPPSSPPHLEQPQEQNSDHLLTPAQAIIVAQRQPQQQQLRPSGSVASSLNSNMGGGSSNQSHHNNLLPPSYARVQREALQDIPEVSMRGKHVKTIYVWEAIRMNGLE